MFGPRLITVAATVVNGLGQASLKESVETFQTASKALWNVIAVGLDPKKTNASNMTTGVGFFYEFAHHESMLCELF